MQTQPQHPLAMNAVVTEDVVISRPGSYTVTVTALPAMGSPVTSSSTFVVIAPGGSVVNDPSAPPRVVTASVYPRDGQTGIPTTVYPRLSFSEPVKNVPGHVRLVELDEAGNEGEAVGLVYLGIGTDGQPVEFTDTTPSPGPTITGLTVQPQVGLEFSRRYRLVLGPEIVDLDNPAKPLEAFASTFRTFEPTGVGSTEEQTGSAGIVVLDNRAYLAEHVPVFLARLRAYDITDPVMPLPRGEGVTLTGRPLDIVGQKDDGSVLGTEGRVVAVATGSTLLPIPQNVWLYDVTTDAPQAIGAASLTSGGSDGFIYRLAMKGGFVYSATFKKGIQTLDLGEVTFKYSQAQQDGTLGQRLRELTTEGVGWGQDAVVSAVPITTAGGQPEMVFDLEAGDYVYEQGGQTVNRRLVVATGFESALIVVEPTGGGAVLFKGALTKDRWRVEQGGVVALGRVDDRDVAVVVGRGRQDGGALVDVLAVVDLASPASPVVLGVLSLGADPQAQAALSQGVFDVVLRGSLALVSGVSSVVGVDLTSPGQPRVVSVFADVGGRLALSGDGLIFSTARSAFGAPDPMGGIHTATLVPVALIDGTSPETVVVGEGPRAAEDFRLKFRVIPRDYVVTSAKVETLVGSVAVDARDVMPEFDQATGRGQTAFTLGHPFYYQTPAAPTRPRFVVNAGTPEELTSGPGRWKTEKPEVELVWADRDLDPESQLEKEYEGVTADYPHVEAAVTSAEWFRRDDERPPEQPPTTRAVYWEVHDPPASVPGPSLARDGFFETMLDTATQSGATRHLVAKIQDVVLGATEAVQVEPGVAATAHSSLQVIGASAVPADGKSRLHLRLVAKDGFGNTVIDDTPVSWEKSEGADGEFVDAQEAIHGGVATADYQAGVAPGPHTLRAHVGEAVLEVQIEQAALGLQIVADAHRYYHVRSAFVVEARVTSAAGTVADGAEVGWWSGVGGMEEVEPLSNGVAKALWHFGRVSNRPRVTFVVTVGTARREHILTWENTGAPIVRSASPAGGEPPSGPRAVQDVATVPARTSVEPMMLAADLTEDGYVAVPLSDGTTEDVFVKATGTYRVVGLTPGERVTVRLGTDAAPNVPPVAHWSGRHLAAGVVPDEAGTHDAQASGQVAVAISGEEGALAFGGTGLLTVPHDEEFEFGGGFMVQLAVRPPPTSPCGDCEIVLLDKAGEYRLALVAQDGALRARFAVHTGSGQVTVTSTAPVPLGTWSHLIGKYDSGQLQVAVATSSGRETDSVVVPDTPARSTSDTRIGEGFTGELAAVRVFDLTRTPLATFAGGATSLSFVADESGVFETPIRSTGALVAREPSSTLREVSYPDEPPPTTLQEGLGSGLVQCETYWEDQGERETTWYGYTTAAVAGAAVKLTRGVLVGSEVGELDAAVMAGDLLGSTLLGPVGVVRDLANSTERMMRVQPSGDDALDMASSLLVIASALTKGKLGAVLQSGRLIRWVPRGSAATKTVGRLVALEVKLAAGAQGVSRLHKLTQIAQFSSVSAQLIGGVLVSCGVHVGAVEAFNRVMTNTPELEQQGVLEEIAAAREDVGDAGVRGIVNALAVPYDETTTASTQAGAGRAASGSAGRSVTPMYLRPTRAVARGARAMARSLAQTGDSIPGPMRLYVVALGHRLDGVDPSPVYRGLAAVERKFGERGRPAVAALTKRLGSFSGATRNGTRFVVEVVEAQLEALPSSAVLTVEWYRPLLVAGQAKKRFYDFATRISGERWMVFECKRWDFTHWPSTIPPSPMNLAYAKARVQWMRDIAQQGLPHLGDGPFDPREQLRWVIPSAFHRRHAAAMAQDFARLLESPRFKKYVGDTDRWEQIILDFGGTIGADGRASGVDPRKVLEILIAHQ